MRLKQDFQIIARAIYKFYNDLNCMVGRHRNRTVDKGFAICPNCGDKKLTKQAELLETLKNFRTAMRK